MKKVVELPEVVNGMGVRRLEVETVGEDKFVVRTVHGEAEGKLLLYADTASQLADILFDMIHERGSRVAMKVEVEEEDILDNLPLVEKYEEPGVLKDLLNMMDMYILRDIYETCIYADKGDK